MNIEELREYCLSLPGVYDRMPFTELKTADRETLVFCVCDKWIGFVNIAQHEFCCIKCDPDEARELRNAYDGIRPGYHMNKKHWISLYLDSDVPDSMIRQLIRKSYDIVVRSLPKREQAALAANAPTLSSE